MKNILYILITSVFCAEAIACSCIQPPAVGKRVESSSAVFIGRVLSEDLQGDTRIYTFEIIQAYKGDLPSYVVITTHRDGATCGAKFSIGKGYLVFAHGSVPNSMSTSLCSANRDVSSEVGKSELQELKELNRK